VRNSAARGCYLRRKVCGPFSAAFRGGRAVERTACGVRPLSWGGSMLLLQQSALPGTLLL